MENRPLIGIAVFIRKDNKVLMLKRLSKLGQGTWAPTGGHLEFKETIEECAKRETLEEAGIEIENVKNIGITEEYYEESNKHYVTIFVVCDYKSGVVQNLEPHKCEEMQWFEWENLPKPLMKSVENFYNQGINPFNF